MDGTEPGVESEQQQSSGQGGARASAPGGSPTSAPGAVVGAGATRTAQPRTSSASSWAGGYAAVVSKGSTGAGSAVSAGGTSLAAAEAGASDTGGNARVTWSSAGTKAVSMPAAVGHSMTDTLLSASTNPGPMSDGVAPSNISPAPGWNGTVSPNMVTASWGASSPSGAYAVPAGRGGNPPNHGSPSGRGTAPNAGGGARSGSAPYYGRNAYTGVPNRPPYGPRSISASAGDAGSDGRYTSNVPYGSGGVSGSAPRPGGGGAGAINVSPVFMGANNMTGYMPDMQQTGGYAMYIPPQYYAPPRNPMAGGEYMPYGMPYNPAATAAAFYRQQYQQQARTPINHGMAFGGERGPSPPGGSTASPGAEISGYAPLATQALSESAQPNALTPNTGGQASISNASPPSYPAESSADSSGSMSNLAIAGDRAAHPASSTEREAPGTNVFTIGTMSMERRPDRLSIPPAPPRRERKLLKIVDPETGQELNLGSVQDELASAKGAAQSVSPKGPTGGAASTPNVSSTTERLSSSNSELVPPKPTGSIVSRETASTNKATVVAPSMDQAQDTPNPWVAAQPNAAPMAFSDRERSECASQTPELPQKTTPLAPTVALGRSESNLTANASAETMDSGAAQLETKLGQSGSLPLTTTDEASIPASCVVVVADQNGYVTDEPDDGKDARVEQVSKSVFVDAELHAVTQSLEQAQIHHEPDRGRIHIPDEIEMAQALPTKETSAATRTDVADGSSAVPEEPVEPLDGDESGSPGGTPADSEPEDDLPEMDDSGQGPDYETDTASLDTDQETEHPGIMVFGPGERRVYPRDWLLCMRAVCISCPTEIEQCEIRTGANFEGVQQRRSGGGGGGGGRSRWWPSWCERGWRSHWQGRRH
ncbi:hypothetical protein F1559_003726 [Cyanidiococcus yangmingshanensis]|uniref:Uncharacterized protein n=1 Tax=Cyanidiococcus yangmingshanensis TaxID=2690220 RepID=A0A7J7ILB8_9RHOD|nr:hypothetical protein F1559_003726 [Cyanidiococcus yangmingshanensis]